MIRARGRICSERSWEGLAEAKRQRPRQPAAIWLSGTTPLGRSRPFAKGRKRLSPGLRRLTKTSPLPPPTPDIRASNSSAQLESLISLALEEADATVMAKHLGLTEKMDQKQAKEMILNQGSGQVLIRSQHFSHYKQVRLKSLGERIEEET